MDTKQSSARVTARLVERARAGDREAYDQLFARAADRVLWFIRLRLGPRLRERLDSMDVLQESYVEAHRAFDRFEYRDDDSFFRWLCRLVENRIRGLADHFGAQRRSPGEVVPVSRVLEKLRASGPGPATLTAQSEQRERLADALEHLETDEREALLLHHFQERSVQEIADLLGKSPSSVRRLLGRATVRLGARIKEASRAG